MDNLELRVSDFTPKDGKVFMCTTVMALRLGITHLTLLRAIDRRLKYEPKLAGDEIIASSYTDKSGKKSKCYLVGEIGFVYSMMGLTGKVVAQYQLALAKDYIAMRDYINNNQTCVADLEKQNAELRRKLARVEGKNERLNFTAAVKSSCITDSINYGEVTNEEYRAIYNKNANALKDILSKIINKPKCKINLRDYFSEFDLIVIRQVEYITVTLLEGERGLTIEQIKKTIRDVGELVRKNKNRGNFLTPVFEQTPSNRIALEVKDKLPKPKD